jgi:hypothetical protein
MGQGVNPVCERCQWFKADWALKAQRRDHSDWSYGECRFNPPLVFYDTAYHEKRSAFPTIRGDEWCGQWRLRDKTTAQQSGKLGDERSCMHGSYWDCPYC